MHFYWRYRKQICKKRSNRYFRRQSSSRTFILYVLIAQHLKVKLSLFLTEHHAMKTYWESGGRDPRILNVGTRRRKVFSFTSRPPYPRGNNPRYPLDRRLDGPQSRSGRGDEKKSHHCPHWELNPGRVARSSQPSKLNSPKNLVSRLRIRGAILPVPYTYSWHGA